MSWIAKWHQHMYSASHCTQKFVREDVQLQGLSIHFAQKIFLQIVAFCVSTMYQNQKATGIVPEYKLVVLGGGGVGVRYSMI